jgi:hypothetical protein
MPGKGGAEPAASSSASASAAQPVAPSAPTNKEIFGPYRLVDRTTLRTKERRSFSDDLLKEEIIWQFKKDSVTVGSISINHNYVKNVDAPVFTVCRAFATVPVVWHGNHVSIPAVTATSRADSIIVVDHPDAKPNETPRDIADNFRSCAFEMAAMELDLELNKLDLLAKNDTFVFRLSPRGPIDKFDSTPLVGKALGDPRKKAPAAASATPSAAPRGRR